MAVGGMSNPLDTSRSLLATSMGFYITIYLPVCIYNIQASVRALPCKDGGVSKPSVSNDHGLCARSRQCISASGIQSSPVDWGKALPSILNQNGNNALSASKQFRMRIDVLKTRK